MLYFERYDSIYIPIIHDLKLLADVELAHDMAKRRADKMSNTFDAMGTVRPQEFHLEQTMGIH